MYLHTSKQLKYFNEVIRLHYEEGYSEDRIAHILPIGHTTAGRWIREYARSSGSISTNFGSFNHQALFNKARTLYESGTSVTAISRITGMSRTTIYKWIAIFAQRKDDIPMPHKDVKQQQPFNAEMDTEISIDELKAKLKSTEAALRKAELRADLYDEIINVAEAKFKISIRKKAGAKQ